MKNAFRLPALFLSALLMAAPLAAGPGTVAPPTAPSVEEAVPIVYPASRFGEVLNGFRATHDRAATRANETLARAAQAHAEWLNARGTLSHTGRNGSTAGQRARSAGCDWSAVAENLAAGPEGARGVVRLWASSSGHRANMLGRSYRRYGLGRAGDVWVLLLADGC